MSILIFQEFLEQEGISQLVRLYLDSVLFKTFIIIQFNSFSVFDYFAVVFSLLLLGLQLHLLKH